VGQNGQGALGVGCIEDEMLQISKPRLDTGQAGSEFISPSELYVSVVGFLRRQFRVIAFVALLALALGAVYVFTTPSMYTARTVMVIDTHKTQVFPTAVPPGGSADRFCDRRYPDRDLHVGELSALRHKRSAS
jgi:Chain length determinant protein